jgi:hypothetical protein
LARAVAVGGWAALIDPEVAVRINTTVRNRAPACVCISILLANVTGIIDARIFGGMGTLKRELRDTGGMLVPR